MPKTRSGLFYGRFQYNFYYSSSIYNVNIDFDIAHKEWVKNKISHGNGVYSYKN